MVTGPMVRALQRVEHRGSARPSVRDQRALQVLHPRTFTHVPSPTYLHPRKHLAHSMVLESSLSSRGTDEPCRSFTHVDAGPSRSIATPQHHVASPPHK